MDLQNILISPFHIDHKNSLFDNWLANWLKMPKNHPDNNLTSRIERVKKGLSYLNIDLTKFKNIIHITGSTGKGTTALVTGAILKRLNLNIGIITKPHLAYSMERCIINDKFINEDIQVRYLKQLTEFNIHKLKNSVLGDFKYTEIMFLSSLACLYQYRNILDYIIVEAGTGIRYDYTNVFNNHPNYFKIITKIEKNHTKKLGNTLQKIFDNKNYNWLNTKRTIYLFPDNKIDYPKKSEKFYSIKRYNFKIYSNITGGIVKFPEAKILTNLIIPEHLYTLGVSIQALTQLNKALNNQIKNKILNKDTTLYVNLPARFMPLFFKEKKLTSIIDNAHALKQYKNLLKNLNLLKKKYEVDIYLLMQFFGEKRQSNTLKLLTRKNFSYNLFKIIPPRGIKLTVNKDATDFTKLNDLPQDKLIVFTGSVYSTGQILKLIQYNTHPYHKQAINNAIYHQKQLVRFLYKHKRDSLSKVQYVQYSQIYLNSIKTALNSIISTPDIIVGFIPFKKELNILPLLQEFAQKNKKIFLPIRSKLREWQLAEILKLPTDENIIKNNTDNILFKKVLGIYQPTKQNIKTTFKNIKELRDYFKGKKILVFLPGLVFTQQGDRIGYGGGVYDKFLSNLEYLHLDGFYTIKKEETRESINLSKGYNQLIYTKRYNEQKTQIKIKGNPWRVYPVITVPVRYPWELGEFVIDFI